MATIKLPKARVSGGIHMSVRISESRYKDQPAISIKSDAITAQFLPVSGGKMCSLVYSPRELELLVQRPDPKYLMPVYDGDYVTQGECAGFDDMFPTIDRCFYEGHPWHGTPIPDHGEVWSIPWDCEVKNDRLHLATYGVRFPYRLEKWVSFSDENTLHLAYKLTNLSAFAFDFMWAAHPMFYLEEGAELALPVGVQKVVTTLNVAGSMGNYGDEFDWPIARLPDGEMRDLRRLSPETTGRAVKYFVKGKLPEGWCVLTYPQSDLTLKLSFPVERVPYLAILPNEGGWQDLYNIFLEPATAPFDRLDVARLHNRVSSVKGRATYNWHLDITLTDGIVPNSG